MLHITTGKLLITNTCIPHNTDWTLPYYENVNFHDYTLKH